MKKIAFILIYGMLFVACSTEKSLEKQMLGAWETTYLKIEMPTFLNSDSTNVFIDQFDKDPINIVQSNYNKDGTFSTWSLNKQRKKFAQSEGKWSVKGDSLFIEIFYGNRKVEEAYQIKITQNGFEGKSKYDWDNDGEFDDLLFMKTKRIELK